jgi:hypothetical protein
MFEKIGRLAEQAATNVAVSRRGFLGRLGQSALGVVGVMAGFAATAATARASSGGYVCCKWRCIVPKLDLCPNSPVADQRASLLVGITGTSHFPCPWQGGGYGQYSQEALAATALQGPTTTTTQAADTQDARCPATTPSAPRPTPTPGTHLVRYPGTRLHHRHRPPLRLALARRSAHRRTTHRRQPPAHPGTTRSRRLLQLPPRLLAATLVELALGQAADGLGRRTPGRGRPACAGRR